MAYYNGKEVLLGATLVMPEGGGNIVIDDELSTNSPNAVQNRVVTQKINDVEAIANNAREGASNAYNEAVNAKQIAAGAASNVNDLARRVSDLEEETKIDTDLDINSENPVRNKVVTETFNGLNNRVTALENNGGGGSITVDSELDATSTNPVQNKAVTEKFAELHGTVGNIEVLLKTI